MREPGPIADYLDTVSRALGFDIALSRRVRMEIEDHLCESIADSACADPVEAQRRAIAKLGDAREIARQYAALSLFAQIRRVGLWALIALVGIYIAMKGRGAWYGFIKLELSPHAKEVIASWVSFDLNAFRIALAVGIIGLGYVASRGVPGALHRSFCRQTKCCNLVCAAMAGVLLASVVSDIVITGFRVSDAGFAVGALLPVLSIAAEIVLMAALGLHIGATFRRIRLASALL